MFKEFNIQKNSILHFFVTNRQNSFDPSTYKNKIIQKKKNNITTAIFFFQSVNSWNLIHVYFLLNFSIDPYLQDTINKNVYVTNFKLKKLHFFLLTKKKKKTSHFITKTALLFRVYFYSPVLATLKNISLKADFWVLLLFFEKSMSFFN